MLQYSALGIATTVRPRYVSLFALHEVRSALRESLAHDRRARLVITASYDMRVAVEPQPPASSRLTISIVYELPRSGSWRIVDLVLARSYNRWCLRRMCRDTKRVLEATTTVKE